MSSRRVSPGDGEDFWPGDDDAGDAPMSLAELREVEAQEGVQVGVGLGGEVLAGVLGHAAVIVALAVRVQRVAAAVPAQVAVELRTDVEQLVKDRHELVVEVLVEEARQTKRHEIQKLAL